MRNCYILPTPSARPAIADLTGVGEMVPKTRTLTRINVPEKHRGDGLGSQLLKQILADADAEGVHLSLEVEPSGPLGYDSLVRWYYRYGFRKSKKYPGIMIRRARPCRPSTYGVIVRDSVEHGFRCGKHGIAASPRFESRSALKRAIHDHWRSVYSAK